MSGVRVEWWEDFFDGAYVEAWSAAGSFENTRADVDQLVELLDLPPGASVLDLGCGFGRIAGPLSGRGYQVTGLDASSDQITLAEQRNPGPKYLHGDMREPPSGPFDAAINVFSSFGYFDDPSEDARAVAAWAEVLRPGGVLVMELMHRDRLAALDAAPVEHAGPVHEEGQTDWVTGVRTSVLTYGAVIKTFRVRMYTVTDLINMLRQAGFSTVDAYGGLGGGPVSPQTRLALRAVR